jgi:hypothetical protein
LSSITVICALENSAPLFLLVGRTITTDALYQGIAAINAARAETKEVVARQHFHD